MLAELLVRGADGDMVVGVVDQAQGGGQEFQTFDF